VNPFNDTSGKWPAIATSLFVNLSARMLQWQNPADACVAVLQMMAVRWYQGARKFFGYRISMQSP
jgi:hypothetical protein